MIRVALGFFFIALSMKALAQDSAISAMINRGAMLYDQQRYELALIEYRKALELVPKEGFVNHQTAMSYYQLGNYKQAIKHGKIASREESEFGVQAIMLLGAAHDDLGKATKSIKIYKKAIKRFGDYYLIWFNLGVTYSELGNFEKAAEAFEASVNNRLNHANSHHALASMKLQQGKRLESLLPLYFYLLLLPENDLAIKAATTIDDIWREGVSKSDDGSILLNLSDSKDEDLLASEMLLSSIEARAQKNNPTDTIKRSFERVSQLFSALAEFEFGKRHDFYTQYYVPLFIKIGESPHLNAFIQYILQPVSNKARNWVNEHTAELQEFFTWLDEVD